MRAHDHRRARCGAPRRARPRPPRPILHGSGDSKSWTSRCGASARSSITGPNAAARRWPSTSSACYMLMAQSGCHVPHERARLPVFSQCLPRWRPASVAENSTFSAFRQSSSARCTQARGRYPRSLHPARRAGRGTVRRHTLAQATVEDLAKRRARWPSTPSRAAGGLRLHQPEARNASVEFDPRAARSTFRLINSPGQSYALAISTPVGLPAALIERRARITHPAAAAPGAAGPPRRPGCAKDTEHGRRGRAPRRRARGSARPRPSSSGRAREAEAQRLVTEECAGTEEWDRLQARREEPPGAGTRTQASAGDRGKVEHTAGATGPDPPDGAGPVIITWRSRILGLKGDAAARGRRTVTVQAAR